MGTPTSGLRIAAFTAAACLLFALITVAYFALTSTAEKPTAPKGDEKPAQISGIVTRAEFRPNLAEDGFYRLIVATPAGEEVWIDATAKMNQALVRGRDSTVCAQVPEAKKANGATVTFNLPLTNRLATVDGARFYSTCWPRDSRENYFFRIS